MIRSKAKVGDKLKLPLNSEKLKKMTENYVVNNRKIKKTLGLTNMPVNARDGFIKTIKSF